MSDWIAHPWMDKARCAQIGGDDWFPEFGDKAHTPKTICQTCPVKTQCLNYALKHRINDGIWGGLSERQRRRIITQHNEDTVRRTA